jgi:DNA-binding NtrC family response regulator
VTNARRFGRCIIIDDDPDILLSARLLLRDLFAEVAAFQDPNEALAAMERELPDVILLDANFGRGATNAAEGFHWLSEILARDPHAVVVMITAHAGIGVAVDAMKRGATDFVSKPWSNERLLATVRTAAALRTSREGSGDRARPGQGRRRPGFGGEAPLLGTSPAMARVWSLIERAGPTDANVLILGENGTGKELVARELHRPVAQGRSIARLGRSRRGRRESVRERAVRPHEGRLHRRPRRPHRADAGGRQGHLFLDEIGNLPLHLQPKLLTALEQRQVVPVGANKPLPIDIRVIAATNCPPEQLSNEGRFRQDLLFRLNTVEIDLPPLRERREDILELAGHFIAQYAKKYGKPARALPDHVGRRARGL